MTSDVELLNAWRAGDRQSGEALFERYYDPVTRFFANKLREGADDLVQQTFKACVEGRDRVRQGGSFRSYLFAIAHNLLRAHFRKTRREADHVDFESASAFDLAPGPSTIVARRREQQLMLEALRRIPLDYQVVLELQCWEEMSTAEIAEVIGVPHPTARSRLRRARELLAQSVGSMLAGERKLEVRADNAQALDVLTRSLRDPASPGHRAKDPEQSS